MLDAALKLVLTCWQQLPWGRALWVPRQSTAAAEHSRHTDVRGSQSQAKQWTTQPRQRHSRLGQNRKAAPAGKDRRSPCGGEHFWGLTSCRTSARSSLVRTRRLSLGLNPSSRCLFCGIRLRRLQTLSSREAPKLGKVENGGGDRVLQRLHDELAMSTHETGLCMIAIGKLTRGHHWPRWQQSTALPPTQAESWSQVGDQSFRPTGRATTVARKLKCLDSCHNRQQPLNLQAFVLSWVSTAL